MSAFLHSRRGSVPNALARNVLTPILTYQLRRALGRLGLSMPLSSVPLAETTTCSHDIKLVRRDGRIHFGLPSDPSALVFRSRRSIAAYLYLLHHCPPEVGNITGVCNDGHRFSAARFSPSTRSTEIIAVPDHYFIFRNGFKAERLLAERQSLSWGQRRSTLTWRGGLNGDGILPQRPSDADNPRIIQRARLCMKAQAIPDTDIRLLMPSNTGIADHLTGVGRAEADWLGDKYAVDIDGWTNAWSNLIIRLHFGCCVLKIASADGYRQWWYDRLVPWEHYVPVRADMSDLAEKADWVRSNDREAQAIAQRGQALARSMTLQTETRVGADIITKTWNRS